MLVFAMSFNGKMRGAFKKSRNQIGELNSQVEDSLLRLHLVLEGTQPHDRKP